MKCARSSAVLLALVLTTRLADAGEEVRSCEYEVKARCTSGDARVALVDGVVSKLAVTVFYCGLPGRPGYSCTIDSARAEKDDAWSDEGGATVISNATPFMPPLPTV
jgi:hypothetical protein